MVGAGEQEDPQHDEHSSYDDASAESLPSQEKDGQEEYKEGGRGGQGGDHAYRPETEGHEHHEDPRILGNPTPDKIEQTAAVADQRLPLPRGEDEHGGRN